MSLLRDLFGAPTPVKILSWALMAAGLLLLAAGFVVGTLDSRFWLGTALILIALSFLVDALLPGGSRLDPEQAARLRRSGVGYRPGMEQKLSVIIGTPVLLLGIYLATTA